MICHIWGPPAPDSDSPAQSQLALQLSLCAFGPGLLASSIALARPCRASELRKFYHIPPTRASCTVCCLLPSKQLTCLLDRKSLVQIKKKLSKTDGEFKVAIISRGSFGYGVTKMSLSFRSRTFSNSLKRETLMHSSDIKNIHNNKIFL